MPRMTTTPQKQGKRHRLYGHPARFNRLHTSYVRTVPEDDGRAPWSVVPVEPALGRRGDEGLDRGVSEHFSHIADQVPHLMGNEIAGG